MAEPAYYVFFVRERQDLSEIFDLGFRVRDTLVRDYPDWRQFPEDHIWPKQNGWIRVSREDPTEHLGQSFGANYTPEAIPTVYLEDGDWPCEVITYDQYVEMLGGDSGFLADDLFDLLAGGEAV